MRAHLRTGIPWLISLAALAYLFSRVPAAEVAAAATRAAPWTVPALAAIVVGVFLADCIAIWKTFAWFVTPLPFRDTLTVRGATYVLGLVSYALGQGAFVYFLNRRGVPAVRAAAAVLFMVGINLILLILLSALGLLLGAAAPPELRRFIVAAVAATVPYAALVAWRPTPLASRPILDVVLGAGIRGHLAAMAVRLPHLCVLLLLNWVALRGFGVHVPAAQALVALPMVLLIAALPISIQGLGPAQGAMILFFGRYASGDDAERAATVLAAGLGAQAIAWVVQILIGTACLRSGLMRDIRRSGSSTRDPVTAP